MREHVEVEAKLVRPAELSTPCGDATNIETELEWKRATCPKDVGAVRVDADLGPMKQERP